jgi:hypothetical protein
MRDLCIDRLPALPAEIEEQVMSNTAIARTEEEILIYEVADDAVEAAAAVATDKVGSVTISFCTGLESCPA